MTTTTKIANITFSDNIYHLHKAYEPIMIYSVVFGVYDENMIKVYTSQTASFDNGNPWVIGVAQNDAEIGDIIEVQYSGMSAIRFYGYNVPWGNDIFLLNDSKGTTCITTDSDIEPYKKIDGKMLMVGHVLPIIEPLARDLKMPGVRFPRYYTMIVSLQISSKL